MQLKIFALNDTKRVNDEQNVKRLRNSNNHTYLWHLHLGHIDLNKIQRLVKEGPSSHLKVELFQTCQSCLKEKMTKIPFSSKVINLQNVLN